MSGESWVTPCVTNFSGASSRLCYEQVKTTLNQQCSIHRESLLAQITQKAVIIGVGQPSILVEVNSTVPVPCRGCDFTSQFDGTFAK